MKCSIDSCRESTRRGMNTMICWMNQLCPVHAAQAGLYKKKYNVGTMPFRKRTRVYR